MQKAPETKGGTYKFKLTKKACELLDVIKVNADDTKYVSFSFPEGGMLLANTSDLIESLDPKTAYNVSMDGIFSNRDAYLFIAKRFGLDTSNDTFFSLEFDRTDENVQDFPVATLKRTMMDGVAGKYSCGDADPTTLKIN